MTGGNRIEEHHSKPVELCNQDIDEIHNNLKESTNTVVH